MQNPDRLHARLSRLTHGVVTGAASTPAGVLAVVGVLTWLLVGVVAGFPDRWNALLWSVASAVTFVMVFLIQHTTDRQSRAILPKLDELIRIHSEARDEVIAVEGAPSAAQEQLEGLMTNHSQAPHQ
jgi:low affinity Fe/Cu permease